MKKIFRPLAIAACALSIGLVSGYTAAKQIKPLPISEWKIERNAYALSYDGLHKQARWVYEHLPKADSAQGRVDRSKFDFKEDPLIPALLRSTKADYAGSGFDRGHLCAAADVSFSAEAMCETFYMSNIAPQCAAFNRGYWSKLEKYIRRLTKHGAVHVFTGGLYLPKEKADGRRFVRYQVIGEHDVAVPSHFFKLIFDEKNAFIRAYILPNEPISADTPLETFRATLEKVERAAGIIFNP